MDQLSDIAFNFAPIGIVLTHDRMIQACNNTFADLSGYSRDILLGQSFRLFYRSDAEFSQVRDIGLKQLKARGDYVDERMLRRRDGSTLWCRFRARTLTPKDPIAQMVLSFAPIESSPIHPSLTPRERDVLTWLAQGMTSKEIARQLDLSPRTVEDVRARLLRKFDVPNASRLLAKISRHG